MVTTILFYFVLFSKKTMQLSHSHPQVSYERHETTILTVKKRAQQSIKTGRKMHQTTLSRVFSVLLKNAFLH